MGMTVRFAPLRIAPRSTTAFTHPAGPGQRRSDFYRGWAEPGADPVDLDGYDAVFVYREAALIGPGDL